jgi:hypothetical protein
MVMDYVITLITFLVAVIFVRDFEYLGLFTFCFFTAAFLIDAFFMYLAKEERLTRLFRLVFSLFMILTTVDYLQEDLFIWTYFDSLMDGLWIGWYIVFIIFFGFRIYKKKVPSLLLSSIGLYIIPFLFNFVDLIVKQMIDNQRVEYVSPNQIIYHDFFTIPFWPFKLLLLLIILIHLFGIAKGRHQPYHTNEQIQHVLR